MSKKLTLSLLLLFTAGCGRYLPPLAPEVLSPSTVKTLEVTADVDAVNFKWDAPENDQRGKELRTMDGYFVYRKDLTKPGDLVNADIRYKLLATLPDTHVQVLTDLKKQALEEGKPTRKVRIDEATTKFTYADKTVTPGALYAYRIVPYNQGDVEGEVKKIAKVLFRGTSSEIILIDQVSVEDDEIEE